MSRALLITIPFSHYCEKARWALDHAGVDYVEQGHVPGFHRLAVRRAKSEKTSVPVLVADGRAIDDSSDILVWADAHARDRDDARALYPRDDAVRREVIALEDYLDEELGPHVRRILYFYLLPRPALTFGLMDQRTPRWQRVALRGVFPLLRRGMSRFMRIDERSAEESRGKVLRVFDDLEKRLEDGRRHLVADRFTAADLTLAALAGATVAPPEHSVRFPNAESLPASAAALLREIRERNQAYDERGRA
jgi:glutathione S-transferase